jgi:hypothetical protein
MITPSYGLTATERVLPKLALDFTTASLDPRVTFTRTGNTATVINSSGLIEPINADIPRFDYNPATLACKGLLIEESRANVSLYSTDFSSSWTTSNSTIGSESTTAPDGAATFPKIVDNTANSSHFILQNHTVTSGIAYTFSVYAKRIGRDLQMCFGSSDVTGDPYANFDLTNGVVSATGGTITARIELFKNGIYRCSATVTSAVAISFGCILANINSITATRLQTYTGDNTSGVCVWGAQLEAGAFATSYIPTEASALTRNADVATMTGTNFSDWFNASEGTLATTGQTISGTPNPIYINDGTANNRINLLNRLSGVLGACAAMFTAGASQLGATSPFTFSQKNTSVLSYKTDNGTVAINALTPNTDNTVTLPVVDRMNIGASVTATSNIWIEKIMFWNIAVTAAEVQAFSKG